MKKFIALLLALCMAAMLCACSKSEETDSTSAQQQTENQTTEAASGDGSLYDALKQILGSGISLDQYELSYEDEEIVNLYVLTNERNVLDYTFKTDDGTTIKLPIVYGDFLNAGWTSTVQWEEQAQASSMGSSAHKNGAGETIYVSIINHTDATVELKDCWVNRVTLGQEYSAGFDIHGIKKGSSVAEVIAAMGNPYNIEYYNDGEYESLELNFEAMDGTLTFHIDSQTAQVTGATYGFSTNYIE